MPRSRIETQDTRSGRSLALIEDGVVRWSSGTAWGEEFAAEYLSLEAVDTPEFFIPEHSVVLHPGPRVKVEQKVRGSYRAVSLGEGDIEIFPAMAPRQIRCGRKDILILVLSTALVERAAREVPGAPSPALARHSRLRDQRIEQVALLLAEEAHSDFAHGRLYGESLGSALAAYLVSRYSSATPRAVRTGGMAPHALRRVVEYIDANLGEELPLAALAEVAGLSRFRFAHNFKHETGLPPHQFVIRERLARARRLLHETEMSVTAIAYAVGFGSPSRFALLFRRAMGTTPSSFRTSLRQ
jgi:AraC family transcriptional regulator